jgi:hypothetical protein
MPIRDIKPINLFKQPDIENGIRINVDSIGKAINAIKEMFEKKPNIIYGISDYKITNYREIIFAFRNWLINNTLNVPLENKQLIKQVFEFHSKITQDHVVAFQSYNLDYALLMCRVNKKFINIEIPKMSGVPECTSIIATYC